MRLWKVIDNISPLSSKVFSGKPKAKRTLPLLSAIIIKGMESCVINVFEISLLERLMLLNIESSPLTCTTCQGENENNSHTRIGKALLRAWHQKGRSQIQSARCYCLMQISAGIYVCLRHIYYIKRIWKYKYRFWICNRQYFIFVSVINLLPNKAIERIVIFTVRAATHWSKVINDKFNF